MAVMQNNINEVKKIKCERCGRLLGIFKAAKGSVKCPRCKHIQKIDLKANDG
jgi:phage FluMu protein Com